MDYVNAISCLLTSHPEPARQTKSMQAKVMVNICICIFSRLGCGRLSGRKLDRQILMVDERGDNTAISRHATSDSVEPKLLHPASIQCF